MSRVRSVSWPGLACVAGGAAVAAGARMPWMSFFVGLRPLRGTHGLYGKLLVGVGLMAIVAGVVLLVWEDRRLQAAVGAAGAVSAGLAVYLLVQLDRAVAHMMVHDPMMIPRRENGLFVVLAGAVVVTVALVLPLVLVRRGGAGGRLPALPAGGRPDALGTAIHRAHREVLP